MAVESATYISQLDSTLPDGTDSIAEGDNQIRLVKSVLQNTFTNLSAAVTVSASDINSVTGKVAKAGDTMTGTLNFSGTGLRITGDFSNAAPLNRLLFQSNVTNGVTSVYAIPNGTGDGSSFVLQSTSTDNTSLFQFRLAPSSNLAQILSTSRGSGTALPIVVAFTPAGTEVARFTPDANVVVGTAAVSTTATAGFLWIPSCAGAPTGAPTAPYTNAAALVVDTTNNRLYVRVGSTWRYATLT